MSNSLLKLLINSIVTIAFLSLYYKFEKIERIGYIDT